MEGIVTLASQWKRRKDLLYISVEAGAQQVICGSGPVAAGTKSFRDFAQRQAIWRQFAMIGAIFDQKMRRMRKNSLLHRRNMKSARKNFPNFPLQFTIKCGYMASTQPYRPAQE